MFSILILKMSSFFGRVQALYLNLHGFSSFFKQSTCLLQCSRVVSLQINLHIRCNHCFFQAPYLVWTDKWCQMLLHRHVVGFVSTWHKGSSCFHLLFGTCSIRKGNRTTRQLVEEFHPGKVQKSHIKSQLQKKIDPKDGTSWSWLRGEMR